MSAKFIDYLSKREDDMAKKPTRISKPALKTRDVHKFATGSRSGQVPEGDIRMTVNIRRDLHKKLKHAATDRETTIGELVEELIDKYI